MAVTAVSTAGADWLAPGALEQALAVAVLLALRVLPLVLLVPWLAVPRAPLALVPAVTAVLVLCLHSPAAASAPALPLASVTLTALGLRELLIGVVYALPLALPLRAIEWSGVLAGRGLGAPFAERALSSLLLTLAAASFFALGGHRVALRMLADELGRVPIGLLRGPADSLALVTGTARLLGDAFALALLLALPALAVLLLVELGVAVAGRSAGARNLDWLLPPLRPALWLVATWVGIALLVQTLPGVFDASLRAARALWGVL
jgi:flagellar biosynthetic protein FliR